ncbi:MAG: Thiol:disulfide interchange protein DsbE [Pseudomonadota bacterium]|jgi:cytochrome c biogenesis protein CcmG, thiol:disulfide interchange protein DsbE
MTWLKLQRRRERVDVNDMKKFLIPLALFLGLVVFLAVGLKRDPREIPSPLINKPAPAFSLPTLEGGEPFSPQSLQGKVWMLNVWATWCVACREEHPVLVAFARQNAVPIVGLSYKEIQPQDEAQGKLAPEAKLQLARDRSKVWLARHGNPYALSVMDLDGRVGIDYGVYGVPETYVIDRQGVIRYKRVGVVTPALLSEKILPLIRELEKS